ncbi:MAG: hypothetical protein ABIK68_21570 [bacterium]
MNSAITQHPAAGFKPVLLIFTFLAGAGFLYFVYLAAGSHPEKAWLVFLINFLLFTSLSLGALLFSTIMHFTKAKWCQRLAGIAEAFSAFFPVSLVLFLVLFLGRSHLFTWIGEDLHGKEAWLNIPFLFTRILVGLVILYGLGIGYVVHSLKFRLSRKQDITRLKQFLFDRWQDPSAGLDETKRRMTFLAGWYMFAFALVLALVGFDLVMSMDPHWYSTLFGAYTFIKAIYSGFGALIIAAAVLHLSSSNRFTLSGSQFRDLSTLFFGFAIVWGDFFYAQFLVIWYGNIPEETTYIIERTMTSPWSSIAWAVFLACFIMPFVVLLRGKFKETPQFMIVICSLVITGFWLEHYLLLAPNYLHGGHDFPIGINEGVITIGFLSLFVLSVILYLKQFPDLLESEAGEVV